MEKQKSEGRRRGLTRPGILKEGVDAALVSRWPRSAKAEQLPLAFSTLGCPAWDWRKILDFAQSNGFAAIELRGLQGSLDLPARPEFAPGRVAQTKKQVADHSLKISDLGSCTSLGSMRGHEE